MSEFRAWFEGFTENIVARPTVAQWRRIVERVAEVNDEPTPWPIFIDRYVEPYRPWWPVHLPTLWSSDGSAGVLPERRVTWQGAGRAEAASLTV